VLVCSPVADTVLEPVKKGREKANASSNNAAHRISNNKRFLSLRLRIVFCSILRKNISDGN